jgi:ADP-L-glycero-D-manno-heptose 6-epimerase
MIIVTGGAGFIGSHLIASLNEMGEKDILVVDSVTPDSYRSQQKLANLATLTFSEFMDKAVFRQTLLANAMDFSRVSAIFHEGACSSTSENDVRYLTENNFRYTVDLFEASAVYRIPFIYASSAAVYGSGSTFSEVPSNERPLNAYGRSKLAADNYIRRRFHGIKHTVVGLRYFNVYGTQESHKGAMASVVHRFHEQLTRDATIRIFRGTEGYADGEHRRDFVFVGDVVRANLHFAFGQPRQAILNIGTGVSNSFNDVASILMQHLGSCAIEYIDFPKQLLTQYQSFTEADISALRKCGYSYDFTSLADGILKTVTSRRCIPTF